MAGQPPPGLMAMSESDHMESDYKKAARAEQLWYTATTMTLNLFIVSRGLPASPTVRLLIMGTSLFISLYATALIANRARKYNDDPKRYRKPVYVDFFGNLWLVIREWEGALFYVLLVAVSCAAVVLAALKPFFGS